MSPLDGLQRGLFPVIPSKVARDRLWVVDDEGVFGATLSRVASSFDPATVVGSHVEFTNPQGMHGVPVGLYAVIEAKVVEGRLVCRFRPLVGSPA